MLGGLLADEMGLGKTLACLALVAQSTRNSTTLVVCPASLLENWRGQAQEHVPNMRVLVYHGADRDRSTSYITSHEVGCV